MVTAELAVALPTVALVALLALSGVQVVMTQLRCRDAAGIAARLSARGETAAVVEMAVTAAAPAGGQLSVRRDGELVEATVRTQLQLLGLGRLLPAVAVRQSAVAVAESGVP